MTNNQDIRVLTRLFNSEAVDRDIDPLEIEQFCSANEITVDYFIVEFMCQSSICPTGLDSTGNSPYTLRVVNNQGHGHS